ncbi:MAG TPA: hypothetical protein VHF44_02495 [Nitrososphaeraceae archaeon]|nr:hypothetical protein [Nitrososphaeraceae archaeon]
MRHDYLAQGKLMPKLETWVALGSLGMCIMFIALILSFFNFLVGPKGNGPDVYVDPTGVMIQLISISGAPSLILAGTVFGLTKSYCATRAAIILITTGIIMISGIITASTLTLKINEQFIVGGIDVIHYIFTVAGMGFSILGVYLFKISKKYQNLEDEIH